VRLLLLRLSVHTTSGAGHNTISEGGFLPHWRFSRIPVA
jgi:hypothetical protein